jgi:hypothetical protein
MGPNRLWWHWTHIEEPSTDLRNFHNVNLKSSNCSGEDQANRSTEIETTEIEMMSQVEMDSSTVWSL